MKLSKPPQELSCMGFSRFSRLSQFFAGTIGAILVGCASVDNRDIDTISYTKTVYPPVESMRYRSLSEMLGNDPPPVYQFPNDDWERVRELIAGGNRENDEFVDDYGNVFTREQLESRDE